MKDIFDKETANATEERYKDVINALKEIGVKPPTGAFIMSSIMGICEDISRRVSTLEIIRKYDLKCAEKSFAQIFKRSTGVSVLDIPKMSAYDRKIAALKEIGIHKEDADKIIKALEGGEDE